MGHDESNAELDSMNRPDANNSKAIDHEKHQHGDAQMIFRLSQSHPSPPSDARLPLRFTALFISLHLFGFSFVSLHEHLVNRPQQANQKQIRSDILSNQKSSRLIQAEISSSGQCFAQEFSPAAGSNISPRHLFQNEPKPIVPNKSLPAGAISSDFSSYSQVALLREDSTLRSVAFGTPDDGLACGDRGVILKTSDGGKNWDRVDQVDHCTFTDIAWTSPKTAIIVGGSIDRITGISRGIVLWSNDAGSHWQKAEDEELPALHKVQWDGSTLKATGDWSHSLLTSHFESTDHGVSWHAADAPTTEVIESPSARVDQLRWRVATNQQITVRDACRTSQSGRCLVGDHGVIALTSDHGKTWEIVRGQQRKTAILFISKSPRTVAWSLVGSEALEERHRVNILCQTVSGHQTTWNDDDQRFTRLQAAEQAAINSGAAGIDEIQSDSVIDLTAIAKQWIAIHEPSVLVLDQSLDSNVKEAFVTAGISRKIKRVIEYSFCKPDETGRLGTLMHRNALLSRTGALASDFHRDAMQWIAPHDTQAQSVQMVALYDIATAGARGESVMNGLSVKSGERLQAKAPSSTRRKLQIARARLQQDSQVEQLVYRTVSSDHFGRLLDQLIASTSKEDQFRLVWDVIAKTGENVVDHPSLAKYEVALTTCRDRFPEHSASHWAHLKLETIQHSNEWRRLRASLPNRADNSKRPFGISDLVVSPFQQIPSRVQQASASSASSPVVVPKIESIPAQRSKTDITKPRLELNWEFHPVVLLSREASRLRNDQKKLEVADKTSPDLLRLSESNTLWSEVLKNNGSRSLLVDSTTEPPHLDGQLDEPCWKRPIELGDGTAAQISHDDEYIYLGVTVPRDSMTTKLSQNNATDNDRDQPLESFDRLKICIDTDRDLLSSMQLQVTATGRVHDAIDGCKNWQPTWYPAIASNDKIITFEIAILRRDLTALPITPLEKWFLRLSLLKADQSAQSEIVPRPENLLQLTFR